MKFKIHKTSKFGEYNDIEINNLEELLKLVKKEKVPIIISYETKRTTWIEELVGKRTLEIYNDYRE